MALQQQDKVSVKSQNLIAIDDSDAKIKLVALEQQMQNEKTKALEDTVREQNDKLKTQKDTIKLLQKKLKANDEKTQKLKNAYAKTLHEKDLLNCKLEGNIKLIKLKYSRGLQESNQTTFINDQAQ